jgi:AraC-like DNA-binding protein
MMFGQLPQNARSSVDRSVALFNDVLGPAVGLRRVIRSGRAVAAIGRWRHTGAWIDVAQVQTTQLVFNLSGGQMLEWRWGAEVKTSIARCGSTAVVGQDAKPELRISGAADTVQIVLDPDLLPPSTLGEPPSIAQWEMRLQALSAQALVALVSGDDDEIFRTVSAAASAMAVIHQARTSLARGGVASGPLRRVKASVEQHLRESPDKLPSVRSLADLIGLSPFHFIRAFKASEGLTPRAWIAARQVDHALHLLLERQALVGEVADQTGYCSPSHFVSDFRRRLGVTPGQVREACLRV